MTELRSKSAFYEHIFYPCFHSDVPLLEEEPKHWPKPLLHHHPQLLFTHPKALTLLWYTAPPFALSHHSMCFRPHAHICSFESSFHRYRMEECRNSLIFWLLESLYINLLIFSSHILTHIHPVETKSQQEAINIPFTYDTR